MELISTSTLMIPIKQEKGNGRVMSNDVFKNVLEFHSKLCPNQFQELPNWPSDDLVDLRLRLLAEEFNEICEAVHSRDLAGLADGLADLEYVLNGFAIACGINLPEVNAAVQKANMAKIGGPTRADGKVLKPAGWESPDILHILNTQPRLVLPIAYGQCTESFQGKNCDLPYGHWGSKHYNAQFGEEWQTSDVEGREE